MSRTDVWFRNPTNYIRECVELMVSQYAFDRGILVKKHMDPLRFAELNLPANVDFRLLAVGDQGTAEMRRGHGMDNPVAVYPTWEYSDGSLDDLEEMLNNPVGQSHAACSDKTLPSDERPVFGQPHMVVVIRTPNASTGIGRNFLRLLGELQDDYPDAILHIHGLYSFRYAFGFGYRSMDTDPRNLAKIGKIMLPNGKQINIDDAEQYRQWVRLLGFTVADLKVARNRCMYNMKSALWAGEHYLENFKFKTVGQAVVDPQQVNHLPPLSKSYTSRWTPAQEGDKFLCDTCSLQYACKFYRHGSICTLPDTEISELATLLGSRDADKIIDGLAQLVKKQAVRLEQGMATEDATGELDPAVARDLNALFANGVKLAKLRNPKLTGGPRVAIQVNQNAREVANASPQELVAGAVAELEAAGIAKKDQTPEQLAAAMGIKPDDDDVADGEIVDGDPGY